MSLEAQIERLKSKILRGESIDREDAFCLISIPVENRDCINQLIEAASEITEAFASKKASLCSLMNAKSGACGENCRFCSQSAHFNSNVETYPLAGEEAILKRAREVEDIGSDKYCLVTSGGGLTENEFEKILSAFRMLKKKTKLGLDASIGMLNENKAKSLREAGVGTVNHNLETSERYFNEICTTHSYEDRKNTIRAVKNAGMTVCSGGIIGMGESAEDRIELVFTLKELDVDIVPVNILNPRPGTPLEGAGKLQPLEIIKTIAVFRFILPDKVIKLAAGRESHLGEEWQSLALKAGANGMIIGGYLTTDGNPPEKDLEMLREAGYQMPGIKNKQYPINKLQTISNKQ